MYGGRDVEINNRIGRILLNIIPPGAERITASAVVGDDWAEVSFEFADDAGVVGSFDFDTMPSQAAGQVSDALIDLRQLMAGSDADRWNRVSFTAHRNGAFRADFSYEDPIEDDEF